MPTYEGKVGTTRAAQGQDGGATSSTSAPHVSYINIVRAIYGTNQHPTTTHHVSYKHVNINYDIRRIILYSGYMLGICAPYVCAYPLNLHNEYAHFVNLQHSILVCFFSRVFDAGCTGAIHS